MRNYKRKPGAKKYADYSADNLAEALRSCQEGMPYREASVAYGIPISTLSRKLNNLNSETPGHPTALSHYLMKKNPQHWRKVLDNYKKANPKAPSIAKDAFPKLLKQLMEQVMIKGKANLVSGFEACGIPESTENPQQTSGNSTRD
ncbi:hypothetical protein ILUMI_12844 [Ignelater luminosus]|uniref:HTH psq-type domain-containing protein n=1 Tax=Ignelater luminosus TaxID=2038154 RepID=A0A8K0CVM6_IGNLU|nr:hypothetical protein ILUMI_12844 [Ignelater luminosus]